MTRKMTKKQDVPGLQTQYVPAVTDKASEITPLIRRFPIAAQDSPDEVCGIAYRVGWVGQPNDNRMLYRLRLSPRLASYGTATFPGFYLLEKGGFVEYVPSSCTEQQQDE